MPASLRSTAAATLTLLVAVAAITVALLSSQPRADEALEPVVLPAATSAPPRPDGTPGTTAPDSGRDDEDRARRKPQRGDDDKRRPDRDNPVAAPAPQPPPDPAPAPAVRNDDDDDDDGGDDDGDDDAEDDDDGEDDD